MDTFLAFLPCYTFLGGRGVKVRKQNKYMDAPLLKNSFGPTHWAPSGAKIGLIRVKILMFFTIFCKNHRKTPPYMVYPPMIIAKNNAMSVYLMTL